MLTDIRLDPTTHDIALVGNNITLNNTANTALAQKVKIALLTKKGEWFVDVGYGVPYYQDFFNRQKNNKTFINNFVIQYVNSIDGVRQVTSYNSTISPNRTLSIHLIVEADSGELVQVNLDGMTEG